MSIDVVLHPYRNYIPGFSEDTIYGYKPSTHTSILMIRERYLLEQKEHHENLVKSGIDETMRKEKSIKPISVTSDNILWHATEH